LTEMPGKRSRGLRLQNPAAIDKPPTYDRRRQCLDNAPAQGQEKRADTQQRE